VRRPRERFPPDSRTQGRFDRRRIGHTPRPKRPEDEEAGGKIPAATEGSETSGRRPPEHGAADRESCARIQTVYGIDGDDLDGGT